MRQVKGRKIIGYRSVGDGFRLDDHPVGCGDLSGRDQCCRNWNDDAARVFIRAPNAVDKSPNEQLRALDAIVPQILKLDATDRTHFCAPKMARIQLR